MSGINCQLIVCILVDLLLRWQSLNLVRYLPSEINDRHVYLLRYLPINYTPETLIKNRISKYFLGWIEGTQGRVLLYLQ